ncbi:MAG: leucyl aminopeptidase family protein [Alphaproteobacteria bacterium]|nr:leucyl aminopeptidase family protein [Alphaproteobacteria bacterium]
MTFTLTAAPSPFVNSSKKPAILLHFLDKTTFTNWEKKQSKIVQTQIKLRGFNGAKGQICKLLNNKGELQGFAVGLNTPAHYLDSASLFTSIQNNFDDSVITDHVFSVDTEHDTDDLNKICIGWGLAGYKFDTAIKRKTAKKQPSLLWPKNADKAFVEAQIASICLIRDLINTPANILGTDELADVAKTIAKQFKAKVKVTKGEKLEKDFPLIHTVGKASPRQPQLVEMTWGKKTDPLVAIVGKGIVYDTGGLNLKPGMYMRDMKKDMGGSAHALGLAWMIMALELPVQLRVFIPIAENAVAGNSYRPGDILTSRKGLTVEIGDTDAEGRLVVADALDYASEENPDLMVDFCTLTGAARVALGYDIPAFFSNMEDTIDSLRKTSVDEQDPVWPLPLWKGYMKDIETPIADITNDGSGRAGAIYGGLFLEAFVGENIDWIHLDCYAWEQAGKAGRPKGGADTGMRALFKYVQERYT